MWRELANFGIARVELLRLKPRDGTAYTVATAPSAVGREGDTIYLSDGAGGNPCLAVSNGTNWLRCDTLATAAAS
jgi:hypothetical protein